MWELNRYRRRTTDDDDDGRRTTDDSRHTLNLSFYNRKANPLEKKQRVHKIIPLQYPDKTPYGWAFEHFYDEVEGIH